MSAFRVLPTLLGLTAAIWPAAGFPLQERSTNQTNIPNCTHPTSFYTQLVDHSTNNSATFQQQYLIIDGYYKPGGPILFLQGDEAQLMECLETKITPVWAQELGALQVALEHRFFGASIPSNDTNKVNKYSTMTLENVMMDSVRFINHIKQTVHDAKDSKVIITGASYGGFLSAVIKLNYPDVFYGNINWAAPVRAFGNPIDDPADRYAFNDFLSEVYRQQSYTAAQKIQKALSEIEKGIQNQTVRTDLFNNIGLCTAPQTLEEQQTFLQYLVNNYGLVSQYDFAQPIALSPRPLLTVVNKTDAAETDAAVLAALVSVVTNGAKCLDWSNPNGILASAYNPEPYAVAGCVYYPDSAQNSNSNRSIFPASGITTFAEDFSTCLNLTGIAVDQIPSYDEWSRKYHITQEDIERSQRMLFPIGEHDPVSGAQGPRPFNPPGSPGYADPMSSRAWVVSEMAHGEESLLPADGDKQSVVHARNTELQLIKGWLDI